MQCWVWISSWLMLAVCEFSNLFLSVETFPCGTTLLYLDFENHGSTKFYVHGTYQLWDTTFIFGSWKLWIYKFHVHETFHLWDTTFIFGSWKSWIYKIGNWIYKILNLYNCTEARMPVVNDLHAEISVKILQISSNFHRESFPILL